MTLESRIPLAAGLSGRYSPAPFPSLVNRSVFPDSVRFSLQQRVLVGACGILLAVPLVVAARLVPDPAGLGTHQQLGLPPCTFQWLFGMRCPTCGMTTSWSHATRGQVRQALSANVGGLLLAVMAMGAAPWCFVSAVRGRWLTRPPSDRILAAVALGIAVVTLIDWSIRIALG